MTTTAPSGARRGLDTTSRSRFGRTTRRAVLTVHIVAAGAWIGIDVVLGVLAVTALTTGNTRTEAVAYQAIGLFVVWPLLIAGLATAASGIALGLGTHYGLTRYWWVAVKLAMNVVLVTLVAFVLRPGLAEVARHGDDVAAGTPSELDPSGLLFPPVVSLAALAIATTLSVFKPWGMRTRSERTVTSDQRERTATPRSDPQVSASPG
jgi:hypothetical protein